MAHTIPVAGGVLALLGSLLVLFVGAALALIGGFLLFLPVGFLAGLFFLGLWIGLLMLVFSILIFAVPSLKSAWGTAVIVLSVLSLPFALGGLLFGFLFGLIGGILTILHRDPPPMMPPGVPFGAWPCPACGAPVPPQTRVCPRCGRSS